MSNLFEDLVNKVQQTTDTIGKSLEQTKNDFDKFRSETKPNIDLNPFDDGKIALGYGNDKQPIQINVDADFNGTNFYGVPLPIPEFKATGRYGSYGIGASVSLKPEDWKGLLKGKIPFDIESITPKANDSYTLDNAPYDPNYRQRIGGLKSLFGDLWSDEDSAGTAKATIEDVRQKLGLDPKEPGGYTVPKGVLAANTGVYAAYLNGKQGFLDKTSGKWSTYDNLSDEQKTRIASDYIKDPAELAKAMPTGGYTKQPLYLPQFQPVKLS